MTRRHLPLVTYRDPAAARDWLTEVLGMTVDQWHEQDGRVAHAVMDWGGEPFMFSEHRDDSPFCLPPTGIYLYVEHDEEVDALHARAVAAGAEVLMEPTDQDYGSRDTAVRDPEGNVYSVGTYLPTLGGG